MENYRYLLDFALPEVWAFRLAIMVEAIERYQHKMQGFQIDFFRHPVLFVPGTEEKNAPLITEMVRALRTKLKELERQFVTVDADQRPDLAGVCLPQPRLAAEEAVDALE